MRRKVPSRRSCGRAFALGLVLGCDPDPEVSIHSDLKGDLCLGSVAGIEAHVSMVAGHFGHTLTRPIVVLLTDEPEVECGRPVGGCTKHTDPEQWTAVGLPSAIDHELSHAVAADLLDRRRPPPGIREGFATAFSWWGSALGGYTLAGVLEPGSPEDVDYKAAGHVLRWVDTAFGADRLKAVMKAVGDDDDVDARARAFARALDADIDELQRRFWAEAPLYASGPGRCPEAVAAALDSRAQVSFEVVLACDDASTRGPVDVARLWHPLLAARTIEVRETGRYRVSADAGLWGILPCYATHSPAVAQRWGAMDALVAEEGLGWLFSAEDRSIAHVLDPGLYALWFAAEGAGPRTISVVVEADWRGRVALP